MVISRAIMQLNEKGVNNMIKNLKALKEVSAIVLLLVVFAVGTYFMWYFGRALNYSLSYESMTQQTVCEMVKPEHLKEGVCAE